MNIETIVVGDLDTNCYLLSEGETAVLVDPGDEADKILEKIHGRDLAAILLTHGHYDHTGAVNRIKNVTGAKVYMHRSDFNMVGSRNSLCFLTNSPAPEAFEVDGFVEDGDVLNFGPLEFKVMHTPGHSAGGVVYAVDNNLFDGDLIFKCSIGRYDFGSIMEEMISVRRVLESFPDEAVIYPGHGPKTTVGYEKKYNPYIQREK